MYINTFFPTLYLTTVQNTGAQWCNCSDHPCGWREIPHTFICTWQINILMCIPRDTGCVKCFWSCRRWNRRIFKYSSVHSIGLLSSESDEFFLLQFPHFTAAIATTSNANGDIHHVMSIAVEVSRYGKSLIQIKVSERGQIWSWDIFSNVDSTLILMVVLINLYIQHTVPCISIHPPGTSGTTRTYWNWDYKSWTNTK